MSSTGATIPPPDESVIPEHARGAATLIVDGLGRIHGCGAGVEGLFGASHGRLIGRPVSAFIVGSIFEGNTPAETARQLSRHCAERDWQRFEALDIHGCGFLIEVNVVRKITDGYEVFVFNLRRPGAS